MRVNRRELFGVSVASATGAILTKPCLATSATSQDPIQLAVVGVRGTGQRHLQQLQGRRDVRIAALCDVDQQMLGEARKVVQNFDGHAPPWSKIIASCWMTQRSMP